jgi:membrane-associated phospholipid phosphatase
LSSDSPSAKTSQFILTQRGLLLVVLFGVLVPLFVLWWLAEAIRSQRNPVWDGAILAYLHRSARPGWDHVMAFLARGGDINVGLILAVIAVMVLKLERRLRDALFVSVAVVGVVIINALVRTAGLGMQVFTWGSLARTLDSGFPSSQAADSFALALACAIVAWSTRWRWLAIGLGVLYVLSVALSRIYLDLHYPSDIVAGWALSLAWVVAASFARRIPIKL